MPHSVPREPLLSPSSEFRPSASQNEQDSIQQRSNDSTLLCDDATFLQSLPYQSESSSLFCPGSPTLSMRSDSTQPQSDNDDENSLSDSDDSQCTLPSTPDLFQNDLVPSSITDQVSCISGTNRAQLCNFSINSLANDNIQSQHGSFSPIDPFPEQSQRFEPVPNHVLSTHTPLPIEAPRLIAPPLFPLINAESWEISLISDDDDDNPIGDSRSLQSAATPLEPTSTSLTFPTTATLNMPEHCVISAKNNSSDDSHLIEDAALHLSQHSSPQHSTEPESESEFSPQIITIGAIHPKHVDKGESRRLQSNRRKNNSHRLPQYTIACTLRVSNHSLSDPFAPPSRPIISTITTNDSIIQHPIIPVPLIALPPHTDPSLPTHPQTSSPAVKKTTSLECPHCDQHSASVQILYQHISSVHQVDPMANTAADSVSSMRTHKAYVDENQQAWNQHFTHPSSDLNPYPCTHCQNLPQKEIQKIPDPTKPLKCPHCTYSSSHQGILKKHITTIHAHLAPIKKKRVVPAAHSKSWGYSCVHCHFITTTAHRLAQHTASFHKDQSFSCTQCDYKSPCSANLKRHVALAHRNESNKGNTPQEKSHQPAQKAIPPKPQSKTISKLRISTAVRKGRRLECPHCNHVTILRENLNQHILKVHHYMPKTFKCPLGCGYQAARNEHLMRHLATIHRKPHKTVQVDRLDQHIADPHAKRKVKCPHCSFRASDISLHLSQVHPKSSHFPCPHCNFVAIMDTSLKQHITKVHAHKLLLQTVTPVKSNSPTTNTSPPAMKKRRTE